MQSEPQINTGPNTDVAKIYKSVRSMIGEVLGDDVDFVAALERHRRDRRLVKSLAVIRARAGLTQKELAAKIGCGQSKVSKLEGGLDADVTFGEFEAIVNATGHRAKVLVFEKGSTLVDEVKSHARAIKRLLDKVVTLAGTDDVLAPATKGFLDTAAFNLLRVVEQAAVNLPPFADAQDIAVEIEASEPEIVDDSNQLSSGADRRQLVDC